jgi:mycothiol S-conjugate amidase
MERAAAILGVEHRWLGFVDSGFSREDREDPQPLPEGCFALQPLEVTSEALVRIIRGFRPQVMTTYDESGGYPHPDHLMTHTVSMAAVAAAAEAERFPEAGEPWQVSKLYFNSGRWGNLVKIHQAMLDRGLESPFQEMLDWIAKMPVRLRPPTTTDIDCAQYFPIRDAALKAHETQVDPDGRWFKVPMDLQQELAPNEEFTLAGTTVPATLPETDLFAGLREEA